MGWKLDNTELTQSEKNVITGGKFCFTTMLKKNRSYTNDESNVKKSFFF